MMVKWILSDTVGVEEARLLLGRGFECWTRKKITLDLRYNSATSRLEDFKQAT